MTRCATSRGWNGQRAALESCFEKVPETERTLLARALPAGHDDSRGSGDQRANGRRLLSMAASDATDVAGVRAARTGAGVAVMNRDRDFQSLVQRYMDGQATADEIDRLNEELRSKAQARLQFIELLNLDSALAAIAVDLVPDAQHRVASPAVASSPEPHPVAGERNHLRPARIRWRRARGVAAVAACLVVFLAGAWWWQSHQRVLATVRNTAGAKELVDGAVIRREHHEIQGGTVELTTALGARVVIEAPRGVSLRVRAATPLDARAFERRRAAGGEGIHGRHSDGSGRGPGNEIRRRRAVAGGGPRFTSSKARSSRNRRRGGKRQSLRDGEAFRLQSGAGAPRELRSAAFIRPEEVSSLHAGLEAGQRASSDAALAELRQDPALVALLDFESAELPSGNIAWRRGAGPARTRQSFVNVRRSHAARCGGAAANGRSSRWRSGCDWIASASLTSPSSTPMAGADSLGQVHWMVTRHTTMRLALFGNVLAPGSDERDGFADSRTSVLPEQGRWVQLATVYDATRQTVRFYFERRVRQGKHAHAISYPAPAGRGPDRQLEQARPKAQWPHR